MVQQDIKGTVEKDHTRRRTRVGKNLTYVLFTYREVPQESTEFSPFELIFGRDVRGPLYML